MDCAMPSDPTCGPSIPQRLDTYDAVFLFDTFARALAFGVCKPIRSSAPVPLITGDQGLSGWSDCVAADS